MINTKTYSINLPASSPSYKMTSSLVSVTQSMLGILKPNIDDVSGHVVFTEHKIGIRFEGNSLNDTSKSYFCFD